MQYAAMHSHRTRMLRQENDMSLTTGSIAVEKSDNVLVATLSNPPLAFMDHEVVEQLGQLAQRADRDSSVGGVVLTGAHPDRFLAHYDVAELLQNARSSPRVRPRVARQALLVVAGLRKLPAAGLSWSRRRSEEHT